jgi:phage terminase small subunit
VAKVPAASAEWDLVGPLLAKYGIVTELDRNTFAMYCGWHAKYVHLENKMREAGDAAYIDVTPNKFTVQSALFSALTRATEMVAKLGAKLGLAPDDRAALLRDISLAPALQGDLFGQNTPGAQSGQGQAPAPSKAQSYFPA